MVEWYSECRKMINLLSLISIILNLFICVINQYKYLIFIVINQIRLALTSILVIKKKKNKIKIVNSVLRLEPRSISQKSEPYALLIGFFFCF